MTAGVSSLTVSAYTVSALPVVTRRRLDVTWVWLCLMQVDTEGTIGAYQRVVSFLGPA